MLDMLQSKLYNVTREKTCLLFNLSTSVQVSQDANPFEMLTSMQMHFLLCKSAIS